MRWSDEKTELPLPYMPLPYMQLPYMKERPWVTKATDIRGTDVLSIDGTRMAGDGTFPRRADIG